MLMNLDDDILGLLEGEHELVEALILVERVQGDHVNVRMRHDLREAILDIT